MSLNKEKHQGNLADESIMSPSLSGKEQVTVEIARMKIISQSCACSGPNRFLIFAFSTSASREVRRFLSLQLLRICSRQLSNTSGA